MTFPLPPNHFTGAAPALRGKVAKYNSANAGGSSRGGKVVHGV